jgi:hypothetical protein
MPRPKLYFSVSERRQANCDKSRKYYQTNKSLILQKMKDRRAPEVQKNRKRIELSHELERLCKLAKQLEIDKMTELISKCQTLVSSDSDSE